ncbi:hypothetical protein GW17_00031007 [Ensete ventricosum]|nr:hypothetical protein GW17_00031007 [Ensete ventricosum]RZR83945.1 hypothetical protein BHM03_00010669 [Ensete ventricosum]
MKNPWNDMISLLPLQEFMSLNSVKGKLCASAPCSIFYVDSLHAAWILHQVPPKLLCSSICIELMVTLTPTIPWVSHPMKNPWNNMIPLLPLQEFMSLSELILHGAKDEGFMSLNSVQGKLRASAPCFIFYIDSLHTAWILHQHATTPRRSLDPLSFVEMLS